MSFVSQVSATVLKTALALSTGASLIGFISSGVGAVETTVTEKLADSPSVMDFIPLSFHANIRNKTSTYDATAAVQKALDTGLRYHAPQGKYIIGDELAGLDKCKLVGDGMFLTEFVASATFPQKNMLSATGKSGIAIEGISFDMRNDVNVPILTDETKENIFYFFECSDIDIKNCYFDRALNHGIRFNASVVTESDSLYITNNIFANGSKGGVQVRRYGNNVHVEDNVLINTVNSVFGGAAFEKPIDISGTIGIWIKDNWVVQNNGDGGSIVVEYIDRQSEHVRISGNYYDGAADGSGIKVGASIDVIVEKNTVKNAGIAGIYIEGCYDFTVKDNRISDSAKNGIICTLDGDTPRVCERGLLYNNTIIDANKLGAALGAPPADGSSVDSYAIYVSTNSVNVNIIRNRFVESNGATIKTFNGIITTDQGAYEITHNDFSEMHTSCITIQNRWSLIGNYRNIADNIGARTRLSGTATLLAAGTNILVQPDILIEGVGEIEYSVVPLANIGTATKWWLQQAANQEFRIYTDVAPGADKTFRWTVDNSKTAFGTFGRTA